MNYKHNKVIFLLFLILIITVNLLWYTAGHKPLHWDSATHLTLSLDFYNSVIGHNENYGLIQSLLKASWYYPPFVYYFSVPFFLVFGPGELAGLLEMLFFLLTLIICVYLVGEKLYNENTGFLAAFCIAMYPIVVNYSRDYMLDLPVASMTAAGIYLLLKTSNYKSTVFSIVSGAVIGLGILTKWTYVLFIIMPVLYFFYAGLKRNEQKLKIILNFILCLLIAVVTSLPWYMYNLVPILMTRSTELSKGKLPFLESAVYYLKILPEQVSLLIFLFFIAAILILADKRKLFSNRFAVYWFVSAYILLSLISYKMPRFSIPLLIPFTFVFSNLIVNSEKIKPRKVFVFVFSAAMICQYFLVSFINLDYGYRLPFTKTPLMENLSSDRTDWQNLEVIKIIDEDRIKDGKTIVYVRIIPDEEHFNHITFTYYAKQNSLPLQVLNISNFPMFTSYAVIIKGDEVINRDDKRTNITNLLLNDSSEYSRIFAEHKKLTMQNGNEIIIYKARKESNVIPSGSDLKEKIKTSAGNFLRKYIKPKNNFRYEIDLGDSIDRINGKVKSFTVSADTVQFGDFAFNEFGVELQNFSIELRNLEISEPGLVELNNLFILSLDELNVKSFELDRESLVDYIEASSKGNISIKNSNFQNNVIWLLGYSKDLQTDFEVSFTLLQKEDSNLYFDVNKFRIFGISFPSFIVNFMMARYNPVIRQINIMKNLHLNKMQVGNNQKLIVK